MIYYKVLADVERKGEISFCTTYLKPEPSLYRVVQNNSCMFEFCRPLFAH